VTTDPGLPPAERPIERATLARRSGVGADALDRLIRLGIVAPRDDGKFRELDITSVRLASALDGSGIPLDDIAAALADGTLPPLGTVLLLEPIGLMSKTYGEIATELGLQRDGVSAMMEALGLPDVDMNAPVREDDAELLELAASVTRTGTDEATLLRTLRVFAEQLDRMAAHQRGFFRRDVQDRMLAGGMSRGEMLAASAPIRQLLIGISFRASHLIHRRLLENNAFENTAEQLEILLEEAGVRRCPDRDPPAMVFVDLTGFTRLTEEEGDESAADRSSELAQVVRGATGRRGGRVVKLLGDGAMVRFERADDAVGAAIDIVDAVDAGPLPPAHVGIAAGPMIHRDGDYFGGTVNVAARICDVASAGQILASRIVAELSPAHAWTDVGAVELRGVPAPVDLVELSRPA
jgi:adenylate cyclase